MERGRPDEVPVVQEAREEDLELLPELAPICRTAAPSSGSSGPTASPTRICCRP